MPVSKVCLHFDCVNPNAIKALEKHTCKINNKNDNNNNNNILTLKVIFNGKLKKLIIFTTPSPLKTSRKNSRNSLIYFTAFSL